MAIALHYCVRTLNVIDVSVRVSFDLSLCKPAVVKFQIHTFCPSKLPKKKLAKYMFIVVPIVLW